MLPFAFNDCAGSLISWFRRSKFCCKTRLAKPRVVQSRQIYSWAKFASHGSLIKADHHKTATLKKMAREDLLDEIEAINAIYPDSLVVQGSMFQLLVPDRDIIIQISFPSSYPSQPPHILSVSSKTYADTLNKQTLESLLDPIFVPDQVCLYEFIEAIRDSYEEPEEENIEPEEVQEDLSKDELADHIFKYWTSSNPLVDRKSTFVAFSAKVDSAEEFAQLLALLKEDKHIQRATHNMTAYRIKNPNGTIVQDCDDDGETAAGSRLLHLLAVRILTLISVFCSLPF